MARTRLRPYRFAWHSEDAPILWLRVTTRCDLACEGCEPAEAPGRDAGLGELRRTLVAELDQRRPEAVALVGGEPLLHPDLRTVVWMIRHDFGLRPILATNGLALDEERLDALVAAGLGGVALQVDASQHRGHGRGGSVSSLHDERQRLIELFRRRCVAVELHAVVDTHTVGEALALVDQAARSIDVVRQVVLRVRRSESPEGQFDTRAALVRRLEQRDPRFQFAAWRPGDGRPGSTDDYVAARVGTSDRVYGYLGARGLELLEDAHHLATDAWSYAPLAALWHRAGPLLACLAPFDPPSRRALGGVWVDLLTRGRARQTRPHLQTLRVAHAFGGDLRGWCPGHPAAPS